MNNIHIDPLRFARAMPQPIEAAAPGESQIVGLRD